MKYIPVLLISTLLFSCTGTKDKKIKTDVENDGLKGKVKAVSETYTGKSNYSNGYPSGGKKITKYDAAGKKIEINTYDASGNPTYKTTYKYNDNGNLIEISPFDINGNVSLPPTTYRYDEKGNLIEMKTSNAIGPDQTFTYKYDENKNIIEQKCINANGSFQTKTTYRYDEKGNLIEEYSYYLTENKSTGRTTFKCDDKGNHIETLVYSANDSLLSKETKKYDGDGHCLEYIDYSHGGSQRTEYKYDEYGNITEQMQGNAKYELAYKYDNNGNWIQKFLGTAENPFGKYQREIEYY